MKKICPVIFFLLLSAYICAAQADGQRIETIRIGFITRELNLNATEAQNFWPAYNGFIYEIKLARQRYPNDEIAFGEARLNIQKRYRGEFKRILGTDDRVNSTFLVEAKFREAMRKILVNRQRNAQLLRPGPQVIRPVNPQQNRSNKQFGPR